MIKFISMIIFIQIICSFIYSIFVDIMPIGFIYFITLVISFIIGFFWSYTWDCVCKKINSIV